MPPLAEQHKWMGSFTATFAALRLLTPLKISYETEKKRAEPSTIMIVEGLPEMGRDTVELVKQAVPESRQAYVLVANDVKALRP